MQSLNAFERGLRIALIGVTSLAIPAIARGGDKEMCSSAYDNTQSLRGAGYLQTARDQAVMCTHAECAAFIRTDCANWLKEIDATQPSVVIVVRDADGHETTAVHVELDGKAWLAALDDNARLIDPGQHKLHYVIDGGASMDDTVEIRAGEKNRKLTATFPKVAATIPHAPTASTPPPPSEPPPQTSSSASQSTIGIVVGGVGVVGIVVGAVFGLMAFSKDSASNADNHCHAGNLCDATGVQDRADSLSAGTISTIAFIAGGVAVGAGVVLFATAPKPGATQTKVGMGPRGVQLSRTW